MTLLLSALMLSSCGGSAFNPAPSTQNVSAVGGYAIPYEYDIVLIVDDTGSMDQAYPAIQKQFPSFLTNLTGNYHATVIPMTTFMNITQVAASQYDSNSSTWVAAFPGELSTDPTMLPASVFQTPASYSAYVTASNVNTAENGAELTLANVLHVFSQGDQGTKLFRPGSQTILVFIGNGNDTSGVNYCLRSPDNVSVPCEDIPGTPLCDAIPATTSGATGSPPVSTLNGVANARCGSQATSMNFYETQLKALFPNLIVYSIVANEVTNQCLGGSSETRIGTRYEQLSTDFNGKTVDLCSRASSNTPSGVIGSIFSDMDTYIQNQNINYQIQYIAVNSNEVPSQVTLYAGGNTSQATVIPQDPTQPLYWTFDQNLTNVNTVYTQPTNGVAPIGMMPQSGNFIHFHINGSGTYPTGNDTFQITELPPGNTTAVSN